MKFLAALLAFVPLGASATIYKWTDEEGRVVYANHAPEPGVKNVQALNINDQPTPPSAAANRALEERIARLERALQTSAPPPPAPPSYSAAVPPPPAPDYYPAPYYPAFGYAYPYAVRVVRAVPRFAARPFISFHHARSGRR